MTVYSSCPKPQYLRTPLPELSTLKPADPLLQLSICAQQEALTSGANPRCAAWWLRSATFALLFGRFAAATEAAQRVIHLALPAGQVDKVAAAWAIEAWALLHQGQYGIVRHLTDQIGLFTKADASNRIAAMHRELEGRLLLHTGNLPTGEFHEAEACFRQAVADYRACGDSDGETRAYEGWARSWAALGNYTRAVETVDAGLARCADTGDWRYGGSLLACAASALSDAGCRQGVAELFDLALDWSDFVGDRIGHLQSLCGKGRLYCYAMEMDAAAEVAWRAAPLHRALEEADAINARPLASFCHLTLAFLYEKAGDFAAQDYHRYAIAACRR